MIGPSARGVASTPGLNAPEDLAKFCYFYLFLKCFLGNNSILSRAGLDER